MKASELKKNVNTSVRVNKTLKEKLEKQGMSLQQFLDKCIDDHFGEVGILTALEDISN